MTTTSPFSPVNIGPLTLANRFVKSGANEAMCLDGKPTQALVKHHRDLAAGGVALTTVAYMAVTADGRTLPNQIWLRPEVLEDLKVLTGAVHSAGGRVSAQLTHAGSFVTGYKVKGRTMTSSGGFNPAGILKGNFFCRSMNEQDMQAVVEAFVNAALLCRDAGFDAVELHMGHGYLLNQFISQLSNKRQDEYGGDIENRMRFPLRVLTAVKAAVGEQLAVLCKISVADGVPGGTQVKDSVIAAQLLEAAGADMLVLSGGRNIESTWYMFGSNINRLEMGKVLKQQGEKLLSWAIQASASKERKVDFKELYFLANSRAIRAAVDMPLGYVGGSKSLDNAERLVAEGFDCVVMARALIHDPDLVNKFQSGETSVSGCTNCNACVAYIYHPDGTRCVLNPPNDPTLNQLTVRQ